MIGTTSFLLELAPVLFSIALAVGGLVVIFVDGKRAGGAGLLVGAAVIGALMGTRYVHQRRAHAYLRDLEAQQVRSIRVGSAVVEDPSSVREIVAALRARQWFSSNHGGWDIELPLEIESDRAAPVRFRVALYHRAEGAVLALSRGGAWSDGYVFCAALPAALDRAGVPLPGRRWVKIHEAQGWTAWHDAATRRDADGTRSTWVRLQKDGWTGATRVRVECAAGRIQYEERPGIPDDWSRAPFAIRPGSVSASVHAALCRDDVR